MLSNQPLIHTRTFRVRHYECDAYGHLNNANYLRYMQETAMDASAAAGYDLARYEEIGHHWLIRETDIEYLRPLRYNEQVEVQTWVSDFQRVRSRRSYRFHLAGTGELVARAETDWVYLDNHTGKPASIPQEMAAAFYPNGIPSSFPPRQPFPGAPPAPPGIFEIRRRVAWSDLDSAQHLNNAMYLVYIEECGMQVIAAHGWPVSRMVTEGFAILLRRHQIQYLLPAFMDDELTISTWASGVKRSSAIRHYVIQRARDGARIANIHTLGVWVDLASGKPVRIPNGFLADFLPNIVQEGFSQAYLE
jgi:acyl-CoA thioester hydrolase